MEFQVMRTSLWGDDDPPVDGATRRRFDRIDQRTFKSVEEHDARFPHKPWASEGEQHKVTAVGIQRTHPMGDVGWFIEMGGMQDVLNFIEKHGKCVIQMEPQGFPSIEIYDGYRE